MEYLNFELRVDETGSGTFAVTARSPVGEEHGRMRLDPDELAREEALLVRERGFVRSAGVDRDVGGDDRHPAVTAQRARVLGQRLFESVMAGPVHGLFRRSRDRADAERKGLRVQLRITPARLALIKWEYLYDPVEGDFVCLSDRTPVVRYHELGLPPEPLTVDPPLSILAVVAAPVDRAPLDAAGERHHVERALETLRAAGKVRLEWLDGSTSRHLQRALRRGSYHVLHFVGHGGFDTVADEGVLMLTDDAGRAAPFGATQFGRLLHDHPPLRLVVLNACLGARGSGTNGFASAAATLIRRGIPAAIAMQHEISDAAAVEFARALYEALGEGRPVDAAMTDARKAVSFAASRSLEWGTPVLHLRAPDGVLFEVAPVARRAPAADAPPLPRLGTFAPPGPAGAPAYPTSSAPERIARLLDGLPDVRRLLDRTQNVEGVRTQFVRWKERATETVADCAGRRAATDLALIAADSRFTDRGARLVNEADRWRQALTDLQHTLAAARRA